MQKSLFQTAICCALQDMTVPAGVIITVIRRKWRAASNGKCLQTVLASVVARKGLEEKDVIEIRDFKKTMSRYGPICTNTSGSIEAFLRYSWRSVIGWIVSLFRRFREPMDAKRIFSHCASLCMRLLLPKIHTRTGVTELAVRRNQRSVSSASFNSSRAPPDSIARSSHRARKVQFRIPTLTIRRT